MQIFEREKLGYFCVENTNELPPNFSPDYPFKALIFINREIDEKVRFAWADWLVETPCRYMLAWGFECSKWDDDVDMANVLRNFVIAEEEQFLEENPHRTDIIPDIPHHIITTWHEYETPNETIEYCLQCDEFDEEKTEWTWIIDFYNTNERLDFLGKFLKQKNLKMAQSQGQN